MTEVFSPTPQGKTFLTVKSGTKYFKVLNSIQWFSWKKVQQVAWSNRSAKENSKNKRVSTKRSALNRKSTHYGNTKELVKNRCELNRAICSSSRIIRIILSLFLYTCIVPIWCSLQAYQAGCWCVWRLGPGSQTGRWAWPAGRRRGIHHKWCCSDRSAPESEQTRSGWLWNAAVRRRQPTGGSSLNPGRETKEIAESEAVSI